jgi:hypothetical protein
MPIHFALRLLPFDIHVAFEIKTKRLQKITILLYFHTGYNLNRFTSAKGIAVVKQTFPFIHRNILPL